MAVREILRRAMQSMKRKHKIFDVNLPINVATLFDLRSSKRWTSGIINGHQIWENEMELCVGQAPSSAIKIFVSLEKI